MNTISIPLSKKKLLLLTIGSFVFVLFGAVFIASPEKFNSFLVRSETFVSITGIVTVLFFGATGIYGIFKMFDKKIGLSITDEGIIENTNATSIGLIKWENIEQLKKQQVMSTKYFLIYTNNQDELLKNVHGMKRKLLLANAKMYGTPFSIIATTLAYDFDAVKELIVNRFEQYKESIQRT